MEEETITIRLSELKKKNEIIWMFVHHHFPFAQGNLDDYLKIVVEKERYEQDNRRPAVSGKGK